MGSEPYDAWISMYNDEIKAKWEKERSELRKISMIYCAFQLEIDKLKATLSDEITVIKTKLKRKDILEKCKNFSGLAESVPFDDISLMNKENESPEQVPFKPINLNEIQSEDFFIESPTTSPFVDLSNSPVKQVQTPEALIKSQLSNDKKKTSPPISYPVLSHKVIKTPLNLTGKKSNELKTSTSPNDSNILECSIIEDTPEINPLKRTKLSLAKTKNSRRNRLTQSKQKTTLTQMFGMPKEEKKKREIDSNDISMSVNKIIDLINQSSDSETDAELDKCDETKDNLNVIEEPPKKIFKSFVDNYDKIPEQKKEKTPDFIYNEPVRGNERKKLKGWSCKQCENYYGGLNLPPEDLEKKKDICSRHKYKFKPREETYTGFWDLTFGPTQKSQDSEKSTVFNYKKS